MFLKEFKNKIRYKKTIQNYYVLYYGTFYHAALQSHSSICSVLSFLQVSL